MSTPVGNSMVPKGTLSGWGQERTEQTASRGLLQLHKYDIRTLSWGTLARFTGRGSPTVTTQADA